LQHRLEPMSGLMKQQAKRRLKPTRQTKVRATKPLLGREGKTGRVNNPPQAASLHPSRSMLAVLERILSHFEMKPEGGNPHRAALLVVRRILNMLKIEARK